MKLFYTLCIIALLALTTPLHANESFKIVCSSALGTPLSQYISHIYQSAFESIGLTIKLEFTSPQTGLEKLKSGEVDGDCGRIEGLKRITGIQEYLRTEGLFTSIPISAWSHQPNIDLLIQQISSDKLRIGYRKGLLSAQQMLEQRGFNQLIPFDSLSNGLSALKNNEIDIWVGSTYSMNDTPHHQRPNYTTILQAVPVYPYLHQRHQGLLKSIGKALSHNIKQNPYKEFLKSLHPITDVSTSKNAIHFSCTVIDNSSLHLALFNLYQTAFKQLGKEFYMSSEPAARAIANINSGRSDGSCGRTLSFGKWENSKDMIRIDVPLGESQYRVWSHSPDYRINKLDDIQRNALSIAYRRGYIKIEQLLQNNPAINSIPVTETEHGLKMLASHRVDLYVGNGVIIMDALVNSQINAPIYNVGLLFTETVFPYLNKRHAKLVQPLTEQLKRQLMKNDPYLLH